MPGRLLVAPPVTNLRLLDEALDREVPFRQWQYVDVTFNATANADTIILHDLDVGTAPEDVDVEVVRLNQAAAPSTIPLIYRDSAGTRRPWGTGYIVLRCNVASLTATLRLSLRKSVTRSP